MSAQNTVIAAFKSAVSRRCQSVQYTCNEFIDLLNKYGVVRSNSRKGNCWDNAVAESSFKTLKTELIYRIGVKSVEQTRNSVFAYIETFYNKKRRHSALKNLSIDEFWNKYYNN